MLPRRLRSVAVIVIQVAWFGMRSYIFRSKDPACSTQSPNLPQRSPMDPRYLHGHLRSRRYMDPRVFRSAPRPAYLDGSDIVNPRYGSVDPLVPRNDYMDRYGLVHPDDPRVGQDCLTTQPCTDFPNFLGRDDCDRVRTMNQNAVLINGSIERSTRDTLIEPRLCTDGQYPYGLSVPMRLSDFMAFPESRLDRLLEDYQIPMFDRMGQGSRSSTRSRELRSSTASKVMKLAALLNFLGASQIAEAINPLSRDFVTDSKIGDRDLGAIGR